MGLHILALHGKQQNGQIFRSRLGQIPRKLKAVATFHIIESPHEMPLEEGDEVAMKTWFNRIHFKGIEEDSLETTLLFVEGVWHEALDKGEPFEAILGFSQGGTLAGVLSTMPERFPGLRYVCCIGAPNNDLIRGIRIPPHVKSLHVGGERDMVVPLEASKALGAKFMNSAWMVHEQGHCVPSRADAQRTIVNFFKSAAEEASTSPPPAIPVHEKEEKKKKKKNEEGEEEENEVVGSAESLEAQIDEMEALEAIYDDLLHIERAPSQLGDPTLRCSVLLSSPALPEKWERKLRLDFTMPSRYLEGEEQLPKITLGMDASLSLFDFPSKVRDALLQVVLKAATECAEMQTQSSFTCIQAALDWLADEEAVANTTLSCHREEEEEEAVVEEEEEEGSSWYMRGGGDILDRSEEEEYWEATMIETATLAAAAARSKSATPTTIDCDNDDGESASSKRGLWRYVIGLVGKPSAGKSTFFNAATKACLHRGGRLEAAVASHPFTTIEPNVGPGYFLAPSEPQLPPPSPPPPAAAAGVTAHSATAKSFSHGADEHTGRRLLPVVIKDVAGLVPGAYKGRGKGNKFLNDLTDADCLVHVVDISGKADESGNIHAEGEAEGDEEKVNGKQNGLDSSSSPDKDAKWIREELHRWIFNNVKAKWHSVVRRFEGGQGGDNQKSEKTKAASSTVDKKRAGRRLVALFTGYNATKDLIYETVRAAGLDIDRAAEFAEEDVHLLVAFFLQRRFPICLALNKVDLLPCANDAAALSARIRDCRESAGGRGESAIPVCAAAEYSALKGEIDPDMHSALRCLGGCGTEVGVLAALSAAVNLRPPILVYPVCDMDSLLPIAYKADLLGSEETNRLRDCLLMKPGSTLGDVFSALRSGAVEHARLGGEFVRATVKPLLPQTDGDGVGAGAAKPCGKESVVKGNCVVVINTNKKSVWQVK